MSTLQVPQTTHLGQEDRVGNTGIRLEIHTVVDLKHDKRWAAKCICILGCHNNDKVRVAHNLFRVQHGRSTPNKMSRFQVSGCLAPPLTWLVVPCHGFSAYAIGMLLLNYLD